jgi:hypothetical protein
MGRRVSGTGLLRKGENDLSKEDPVLSEPFFVITGLVPVIPIRKVRRFTESDGRDKPGHDVQRLSTKRTGKKL